jgi:hypothetical protein
MGAQRGANYKETAPFGKLLARNYSVFRCFSQHALGFDEGDDLG